MVANTSCRIDQDQVINLNDGIEHLSFRIMGQSYLVHFVDPLIGLHSTITRDGFEIVIKVVKAQCTTAFNLLVTKLEQRFPNHGLMNALGIIYPQYWLQLDCESTFAIHLSVIKQHYYTPKQLDASNSWVYESLSRDTLDIQSSLFKMTMKTQASKVMEKPKDKNPIIKLWFQLTTNSLLVVHLSRFMKLIELAIVQVIGIIENERTFSILTFMKLKLWN